MPEREYKEGSVRYKGTIYEGAFDGPWQVVQPGEPLYSLALMIAEEVFLNGEWRVYGVP